MPNIGVICTGKCMRNWEELSFTNKLIVGLLIIIAASFAPELMLLVDFGGIELAFTFLLLYCKPLITWLTAKYSVMTYHANIARVAFINSTFFQPRIFVAQAVFCCLVVLITGSVIFSTGFLLPGLLVNGLLV